jgi:hypothetical protein
MQRFACRVFVAFAPAWLLCGCGGGESSLSQATVEPPHRGHMFALPENRGYVEIMTDREGASRGSRAPATKARILAYFYQPDGTTAMAPPPTDVKVQIGVDDKSTVVALAPQPKEAGLFASEPGMYPDGFRGQIEAQVNGEAVKLPFLFR